MKIGDVVVYHDEVGEPHNALITATYASAENPTSNVVFVSGNESETDAYGRQTKRESSVSHASNNQAHGRYWRRIEEQPNQRTAPIST